MNSNYFIQITEGDYTATYTIYYGSVSSSNIATLLGTNLPAEGISLDDMLNGVRVSVPGTTSLVILFGDGYCKNSIEFNVTPVEVPTDAPDLCMRFITDNLFNSWQFTPTSSENGKTKWETTQNGRTYSISWNPLVYPNRWEMSFEPSVKFISTNNSDIPDSAWIVEGFSDVYDSITNLNVIQGTCPVVNPLDTTIIGESQICQGTTKCTGIITVIETIGGTPPYYYSLDSGSETVTTIFENVCSGIHTVVTTDSNGLTTSDQITIEGGITPISYTTNLIKTTRVVTDSINRNVERTDWEIQIVPELDATYGVNLDLNFVITQSLSKPGTGTFNYTHNVYIDGVLQTPTSENVVNTTSIRTQGCEAFNVETTRYYENYNNVTLYRDTKLTGYTISDLEFTQGSAENVNGCTTILKQGVSAELSNSKYLGPCSTFEVPKGDVLLQNELVSTDLDCCPDGYTLVGDFCEIITDVIEGNGGTTFTVIEGDGTLNSPQNGTIFYSNVTNLKKPLTFTNSVLWNPATSGTTGVQLATSPNCVSRLVDGTGFYNTDGTINASAFSVISRTFGYYDVNLRGIPVNQQIVVKNQNASNNPWFGSNAIYTAFGNSGIRAQLPGGVTNLNQWFGIKYCFTSTTTQNYHLFLAADDTFNLKLDGEWLVKRLNIDTRTPSQYTSNTDKIQHSLAADGILDNSVTSLFQSITISWNHVIPITIPAGEHVFEFAFSDVFNYGDNCCTTASFEVYTGVTTAQLTGMTSYSQLSPYTAFSTSQIRNTDVTVIGNFGDNFGIYCLPDYTLEGLCLSPFCVKRQPKSC